MNKRLNDAVLPATLALICAFFSGAAIAVDGNGAFELDGNPQEEAAAGDDWETLESGGGSANQFVFIQDRLPSGDNIYTGGGSKVPLDFPGYKWKSSPPPPDKNNIVNAYAANYIVGGEQIVYFGADLFADNGDAELAFWFLQDDVGLNPNGTFSGVHVNGDVYAAVKFSNGGATATGTIFEWDSSCAKDDKTPAVAGSCAAMNIRIRHPASNSLCDSLGGKIGCAITNTMPVNAEWDYTPKAGADGVYPPTTFFEAGLNIYELFGENKCFSSFLLSTGASTSFQSTAKDFALGDFNVCSIAASKTCVNDDEGDDAPAAITYNVRGCAWNDGGGSVNVQGLANSIGGGDDYVPGDLEWFDPPGDFDPANDCDDADALKDAAEDGTPVADPTAFDVSGGDALVYQFTEETAINAPMDEVTIMAEGTDGALIDPASDTATCPPRTFNADLSADKYCSADLEVVSSRVVVRININGQVCNDGEVTLTDLMLSDTTADGTPVLTAISDTLEPGDCTDYSGYYYPESIPSGNACPFMDMVTAEVQAPVNSGGTNCSDNGDGTQTCTVDSNSATCLLRALDDDSDCATGPVNPDID
jgi:hypothetical protein